MPTSRRDAQFLRRMAAMIATGVALLLLGVLLDPPRALWHALHKEN